MTAGHPTDAAGEPAAPRLLAVELGGTLRAAQLRHGRFVSRIRGAGWSLFAALALGMGYLAGLPDWRAIAPLLTLYAAAIVLGGVLGARSPRASLLSPATIAIDVCIVGYLQARSIQPLAEGGALPASASGTAGFTVAIFVLLLVLVGTSLQPRWLVPVTVAAVVSEYLLQDAAQVGPGGRVAAALLIVLSSLAVAYASRSQLELVAAMEDQQRSLSAKVSEQAQAIAAQRVAVDTAELVARTLQLTKEKEVAEAATSTKSMFLANVSHELRTPLNAVIGMCSVLVRSDLDVEHKEQVEIIRTSGEQVLALINDILDLSKIDAGRLELEALPIGVRDVVEPAIDLLATQANEKGLELGYRIEPGTPGLTADPGRLRQILVNLVANAVKFTARGEVVVTVSATQVEGETWRFTFRVRDTGIGIPEARRHLLFQPFTQVDASTTRQFGGTGLGLAISARLAGLMRGEIRVESEVGRGSTFELTFLATEAETPAPTSRFTILPGGSRILLAYRNEALRGIVARRLADWGFEPEQVGSSEDLRAALAQRTFDAVVLDEALRVDPDPRVALRGLSGGAAAPPTALVLVCARHPLPLADEPRTWVVLKPIKPSTLYDALAEALSGAPRRPRPARGAARPASTALPPARLRILVVEDNAVNQKVAAALLKSLGYSADFAGNGHEAIAAVERQPYDVVFMDVQMPELDGLEATRRICRRLPPERRPRIVAMTANAMVDDSEACREAGMDDYLAKPVTAKSIADALTRCRALELPDARRTPAAGTAAARDVGVVVDPAILGRLRAEVGEETFVTLTRIYLEDSRKQLASMLVAATAGDGPALRVAAHTMKSTSATFGAAPLAGILAGIEARAERGRMESMSDEIEAASRGFLAVWESLEAAERTGPS
jgi:signal transduction histidine kinase/DNA-binding response OmpR family regulator